MEIFEENTTRCLTGSYTTEIHTDRRKNMAIGERIRFIRNLRGMTQKWLGMAVGFPERAADVRMAQYESGTRTPKENLVNELARVLEVSPSALDVPNIESYIGVMHTQRICTVLKLAVLMMRYVSAWIKPMAASI